MDFSFSRTLAQTFARDYFAQAVRQGAFPHAMLVHGSPGLGQAALLLDVADILLCEAGNGRPCGICLPCRERRQNRSERLHFLFPCERKIQESEEALAAETVTRSEALESNPFPPPPSEREFISITQIRALQTRLAFADAAGKPRLVLLFWAESMPQASANAFLKLLEEPPPNVHFLLSTERRSALLPTIVSRCIQVALRPLTDEEMRSAAGALRRLSGAEFVPRLLGLCDGSPGAYVELVRLGGDGFLAEASRFLEASARPDWETFSGYLEESAHFQDPDSCLRLLMLCLRLVRRRLRLEAGSGQGNRDISGGAADAAGSSLEEILYPLAASPDLERYAAFLEDVVGAVRGHSKPVIAAMASYLEYETASPAARA